MLITFYCQEYENITMFGNVAKRLLTMMGHSATIPGAILAQDIPQALSRLQQGIEQEKLKNQRVTKEEAKKDQDDDDFEVSLAIRALPLIKMLQAASKNQCNVMWK